MYAALETVLSQLSDLQQRPQQDAAVQRGGLTADIAAFAQRIQRPMMMATALVLTGGMAILYLYIRPVIIRPMQRLPSRKMIILG